MSAALYAIWSATVSIFKVNNEIELGNAIWASLPGDKIILNSGEYGNIPLKQDVSYDFEDEATAADILGLGIGIGGGEWSASSVEVGSISITNPRIQKANIKLYYIFQKKLPFNSRFEPNTSFVHANGVIIQVIDNDKQGFSINHEADNAESCFPKAVVNIIVPVLEEFNIDKSNEFYKSSIYSSAYTEEEKTKELQEYEVEKSKRDKIEKNKLHLSLGLQLNEPEYKAIWALNSFIREYSKITQGKHIRGFSFFEFQDGICFTILKDLNNSSELAKKFNLENTPATLDNRQVQELAVSFLSSQEYLMSDFIQYHLNCLNYTFAIIGMYQEFESLWKLHRSGRKEKDKWAFIDNYVNDDDYINNFSVKANLAEMINARNNIVHDKTLKTYNDPGVNKLKTEWGSKALNEYEIYAKKRPWYWANSLQVLKTAYNNHVN